MHLMTHLQQGVTISRGWLIPVYGIIRGHQKPEETDSELATLILGKLAESVKCRSNSQEVRKTYSRH